jgi:cell division protein FtsN
MAGSGGSAATASNAPAAPTPSSSSSSGGIGGFFSNLFGGGSSSEEKPAEPPTSTASIGGDNAPPPDPAASGWGAGTEVVAHSHAPKRAPEIAAPFVTQVASVDQQPTAPLPPAERVASPSGKYRLQVAAVRSRSEAEALAGLLVGRHADQLGGRHPEVDESVIGSMGTFYRVRLGPYASAQEPEQLCAALRSDGFDCLVLGQ